MSWATDMRQAFITSRLAEAGSLRRKDICDKFRVNIVTASTDIQRYLREHPGVMTYDNRAMQYVRVEKS